MSVPNIFIPHTTILSSEVNENFEYLLTNGGALPGQVVMYAGATAPTGWLKCEGQSLLRADYLDLFDIIGTTFGSVDGTHFTLPDFRGRVPMGAGTGTSLTARTLGDTLGYETHTLTTAEMPSHTHTQDPHTHTQNAHDHTVFAQMGTSSSNRRPETGSGNYAGTGASTGGTSSTTATNQNATATNQNTGGGGAHNNIQPSLVINFIIKS